ncbi:threonine-phosphate decarboxylase CobD [Thermolongibacillus altinsuensis]|uniref:threonine-phosphate decarboxylase CobD n=1 Tax=Thermolongibacillus altinsuensis TaxID=575256 RepID=UPI00242A324D|nr:threonine-phosphate decarboxylase CobD [Thermolongibacillus altinsuensis]GMB07819.1 threonine-phosphate decarboxylase [Thermolongibacillus altinsuensis]
MQWPAHGANPLRLYEALQMVPPKRYIDFSVNTNPYPLPEAVIPTQAEFYEWVCQYPDPDGMKLISTLAEREGVQRSQLLLGNGASECIYLLAQWLENRRVGIFEPTFSEYRRACELYGCSIHSFHAVKENGWLYELNEVKPILPTLDALFLCHPNNPTGTIWPKETLQQLLMLAREENVFVIVDEAFYDFWLDGFSVVDWLDDYPNVIVLRSLTKMYHLAGARLGYVVAHENVITELKKRKPPWSVNTIAQQLALRLLSLSSFVDETKRAIASERQRVISELRKLGYDVSPSVTNFYLLGDETKTLFYAFLRQGLIPRHTFNFPGLAGNYLRFAVRTKEENDELLSFLRRWSR